MAIYIWILSACLVDWDTYKQRKAELTDNDGDGLSEVDGDCDDNDKNIAPSLEERCDTVDNDCDGTVDESAIDAPFWYRDADGDGSGDITDSIQACHNPIGFVGSSDDCNDSDADETPGRTEVPYDGLDNDCIGGDLTDVDSDGIDAIAAGGDDCDDSDDTIYPGAEETWSRAFSDSDCDGTLSFVTAEFGAIPFTGSGPNAQAGRSLASVGDLDGDGAAELLVGAVYDDRVYSYGGAVHMISGVEGGRLSETPTLTAGGAMWFLGTGLGGGEDMDDDGVPDLLVSATGYDSGAGACFAVSGAVMSEGADHAIIDAASVGILGTSQDSYLGTECRLVGDITGDGVIDIVVTAPFAAVGAWAQAGRIAIFTGAEIFSDDVDIAMDDAAIEWGGYYDGARFGNFADSAGDQDGDGIPDLAISAEAGLSLVILPGGSDGGNIDEHDIVRVWHSGEIPSVRMVGDVDGDGQRDAALLGTSAWIFTDLNAYPSISEDDAYAEITSGDESVFYDAIDIGDRDGDGRAETALTVPYASSVGTSWLGIVEGASVSFGMVLDPHALRLQALSTRRFSNFGYRAALMEGLAVDGIDQIVLGGWSDDEAGTDAGAVVFVETPQ